VLSYFKDSHVHTVNSHDGKSTIKEYLENAKNHHVDEITFTDHYDIYDGVKTELKTLDVDKYRQNYDQETKNAAIKTHFGIEIGLRPEAESKIKEMVKKHHFDFIIGSSHITCGIDVAMNRTAFFKEDEPISYGINKYFDEVLKNISIYDDEFDVYGHLDYIIRYARGDPQPLPYDDYREIIDQILRALIKKGKGIEVNSSGIRYGIGTPHPRTEIVRRYIELGGKIVTLGSDAHRVEDLAASFGVVRYLLIRAGVREIAVYENREPRFMKI